MTTQEILKAARGAKTAVALSDSGTRDSALLGMADALCAPESMDAILAANAEDMAAAKGHISDVMLDRLALTPQRIEAMAKGIRDVAALPDPVGRVLSHIERPNGLVIEKTAVPMGVIAIIYESRPNVTSDAAALAIKSGNACILKGGSDADASNRAIISVIHDVLKQFEVDLHVVELLPSDREATAALLHANGYVDLIIPRGSSNLINFVRQNATIPVIETGAGICHTFFDRYGDVKKGAAIVNNAKTRRVSVCNALDCLLVDGDRMKDLPALCAPLQESNVIIYADTLAYASLQGHYPAELLKEATEEDFGTEFLDYKLAVKVVEGMDSAIAHIQQYGSKHSECIVTEDKGHADWFCREVDAACVYVNAPTSFTDGAQFGLGAEIGISTQKLHARGPMALEEITTYKWIIEGEGQIRK